MGENRFDRSRVDFDECGGEREGGRVGRSTSIGRSIGSILFMIAIYSSAVAINETEKVWDGDVRKSQVHEPLSSF